MAKADWTPRIILRQQIVDRAPERWAKAYAGHGDTDKTAKTLALAKLVAPIQAADVDRIIGNTSWTDCPCDLCKKTSEVLIRVGDEPDYEARWLDICPACIAHLSAVVAALRSPVAA